MKSNTLFSLFLTLFFSCSPPPPQKSEAMDPRVAKFIATQIKDGEKAGKMARELKGESFEEFIYAVYTGETKMDATPDNSQVLALLGTYLAKEKPDFDSTLIDRMELFNQAKGNKTMIRSLIVMTLNGVKDKRSKRAPSASPVPVPLPDSKDPSAGPDSSDQSVHPGHE